MLATVGVPPITGNGAAVDQNGPGRVAADGDGVAEIVAEDRQEACAGEKGRCDCHGILAGWEGRKVIAAPDERCGKSHAGVVTAVTRL